MDYQVVIIGGGPAAHSAALILGRARKRVLMADEGRPENRVAKRSHSFFSRDATPPLELRRIALEQIAAYDTVQCFGGKATQVDRTPGGFSVQFDGREAVSTEIVLLALGMELQDPCIPGFDELWGDTVIHCPYCHGWEVRDLPWAVYLTDVEVPVDPMKLVSWSEDVVVIVEDGLSTPADAADRWKGLGFGIEHGRIRSLQARDGRLESVELVGGRRIPRSVLLYAPPRRQASIVQDLQLDVGEDGCVVIDAFGQTSVEGIYAAGDMTTVRHQIAFAAASGARTAMAIHGVLAKSARLGG